MARRKSKNEPAAVPAFALYTEPKAPVLRKESRWSRRSNFTPGEVPAGMRMAFGPQRETAYGECRGVELPCKLGSGMRKNAMEAS